MMGAGQAIAWGAGARPADERAGAALAKVITRRRAASAEYMAGVARTVVIAFNDGTSAVIHRCWNVTDGARWLACAYQPPRGRTPAMPDVIPSHPTNGQRRPLVELARWHRHRSAGDLPQAGLQRTPILFEEWDRGDGLCVFAGRCRSFGAFARLAVQAAARLRFVISLTALHVFIPAHGEFACPDSRLAASFVKSRPASSSHRRLESYAGRR